MRLKINIISIFAERFKGHLCPLSFNDEFLQDLLRRGIIKQDEQLGDTSTAANFKSMCARAVVLLNYIEHIRIIISSKSGDLKVKDCKYTTLFYRYNNVVDVYTTLYQRQNNVVCLLEGLLFDLLYSNVDDLCWSV